LFHEEEVASLKGIYYFDKFKTLAAIVPVLEDNLNTC
jgi:hypothetical protein